MKTAKPDPKDLIPQKPFTESELSIRDQEWRNSMYKGWQSIGFSEGRSAAYDYIKANPDCTFTDLIQNVKFEKEL